MTKVTTTNGRRPTCRHLALLVGLLFGLSSSGASAAIDPEWVEKWRADIETVAEQLREIHPDPFTKIDEASFDGELKRLLADLTELEHHQIVTRLATAVARVGDGHTRLTLPLAEGVDFFQGHMPTPRSTIPDLGFRAYPLRIALVGDELYVHKATPEHRNILGARIVRYGDLTPAEAIAAVAPTVRRDNDQQLMNLLPEHLVLAELLEATGVTEAIDALRIEVMTDTGERLAATLSPVAPSASSPELLAAGPERTPESPHYLRQPETPYWFEWLPDPGVVYFQLNQVGGPEEEKLDEFATRLFATLDEHSTAPLIIDLRHNPGGWYGTAKHLLRSLLRRDLSHETGGLIVITGRTTFSAAMMLAVDLEKHSNVLFIGEPTGSSPNHHGDARRVVLPNSGLTVRISTLYWQAHPSDGRQAIEPHLVVEPSWRDYLDGRDPVLETALAIATLQPAADPSGQWQGAMSFPQNNPIGFSIELDQTPNELGAVWRIPAFSEEDIPLQNVTWKNGRLSASTPWQGGNVELVTLDAEQRRGYLVGTVSLTAEMGTERLPFVLKSTQ